MSADSLLSVIASVAVPGAAAAAPAAAEGDTSGFGAVLADALSSDDATAEATPAEALPTQVPTTEAAPALLSGAAVFAPYIVAPPVAGGETPAEAAPSTPASPVAPAVDATAQTPDLKAQVAAEKAAPSPLPSTVAAAALDAPLPDPVSPETKAAAAAAATASATVAAQTPTQVGLETLTQTPPAGTVVSTPAPAPAPPPKPLREAGSLSAAASEDAPSPVESATAATPETARASAASPTASPASATTSEPSITAAPTDGRLATAETDPDAAPEGQASVTPAAAPTTQVDAAARNLSLSTLSQAAVAATTQIAAQIIRRLDAKNTRFEMALTPDDLGRVDVSLDIDADGRLAARLAFDNPIAATDLRGRVDELRRQLEEAGFQLADDAFQFAERDRSSGEGFDRRQGRAFAAASRLTDETDALATPPGRWMSLSLTPERVDMKV